MFIGSYPEKSQVKLVSNLVNSGAIRFRNNHEAPLKCDFRMTAMNHVGHMAELMSGVAGSLCDDCEAIVRIAPHESYRGGYADPLLLAFAQTRSGVRPLHLYQVKKRVTPEEPCCKVLLVEAYLGDLHHMEQRIQTLCDMSVKVVGALTFLSREDKGTLECPLTSVFTGETLMRFCREHSLVPPHCRHAVDRHLRELHQLQ